MICTGINLAGPVGQYLAGLGVLYTLSIVDPTLQCWWEEDGTLAIEGTPETGLVGFLGGYAQEGLWRVPIHETHHILIGPCGARKLARHVPKAREALRKMPAKKRDAQLRSILTGAPVKILAAKSWGCGTVLPRSMKTFGAEPEHLSPWWPVLIWQAAGWLSHGLKIDLMTDTPLWLPAGASMTVEEAANDMGYWVAPFWRTPRPVGAVGWFFRPGKKFTARAWTRWMLSRPLPWWRMEMQVWAVRHLISDKTREIVRVKGAIVPRRYSSAGADRVLTNAY